jgi:hypothetical protein
VCETKRERERDTERYREIQRDKERERDTERETERQRERKSENQKEPEFQRQLSYTLKTFRRRTTRARMCDYNSVYIDYFHFEKVYIRSITGIHTYMKKKKKMCRYIYTTTSDSYQASPFDEILPCLSVFMRVLIFLLQNLLKTSVMRWLGINRWYKSDRNGSLIHSQYACTLAGPVSHVHLFQPLITLIYHHTLVHHTVHLVQSSSFNIFT